MKPVLVVIPALLGACATGTIGLEREAAPRAAVKLDLVPHPDAQRTFPAVIDAQLPSADRMSRQIVLALGDTASVEVRLCVAAAGSVESIAITKSSSLPGFDDSVLADAKQWRFAVMPGPKALRTCDRALVTYRPST